MSLMTSQEFAKLLQGLTKVTEEKFKELPTMIPTLFSTLESDKAWEDFYTVSGVPDIPKFNGDLEYLQIVPGYFTTIEPAEYAGGLEFQRKLIDDNQFNVLKNQASALAASAQRTREKTAATCFTQADSVAFEFMKSEEGVALCSNSHTTKSGTSTSVGFDNYDTSAFSKTSVAATRLKMRNFRNSLSNQVDMDDNFMLLIPDALAEKAYELNATMKGLDSGMGNANFNYQRYDIQVWNRLDDVDTTDWWMINKSLMKQCLYWLNRINPETAMETDHIHTFSTFWSVYFRNGFGHTDWRWIDMNKVA